MYDVVDKVERISKRVIELVRLGWYFFLYFEFLEWLRDNDFLLYYYRFFMSLFRFCFKSIFKIYIEIGNIWIYLIGFFVFICVIIYMFLRSIIIVNFFFKDW